MNEYTRRIGMSDLFRSVRPAGRIAVAAGLAFIVGCGGDGEAASDGRSPGGPMAMGGAAQRAIPVGVEVAGPTDLQVALRASANLRARQQVEVLPKQGGVIARILVEEGAAVRQGQPLAVLDDAEWRLQARQSAARAQAARDALERGLALQERGLLANQEVERLRSDAEVASADAALADLRVQNATIASPLAGIVTHRNVERGQQVGTNMAAFTVADLSRLEADVGVPDREAARVTVGQPVRIRSEGQGAFVMGRVARVRPVVDPGSGTVQVTVEVDAQQLGGLRAGQFVNVEIVTQVLAERLALPRTAVLVDGPTPRVFRVSGGMAEEVPVEVGGSHGERVEIRSGVQRGDTIIVVGQDNLRSGVPVMIMEIDGTAVDSPESPPVLAGPVDREAMEARFRERGMTEQEAREAVDRMQQRGGAGEGGAAGAEGRGGARPEGARPAGGGSRGGGPGGGL
jgi:membrane fusion protein, multidrug efflux system